MKHIDKHFNPRAYVRHDAHYITNSARKLISIHVPT